MNKRLISIWVAILVGISFAIYPPLGMGIFSYCIVRLFLELP